MLTAHRSRIMAAPASAAPTIFVENIRKTNSREPSPAGVGITPASICAAAVMHTICQRETGRSADNTNQGNQIPAGELCKIAQKKYLLPFAANALTIGAIPPAWNQSALSFYPVYPAISHGTAVLQSKSPIGKRRACRYRAALRNQRCQTDSRCQKRRIAGDAFILRKQQTEKANQTIQRNRYFMENVFAPWTVLPACKRKPVPVHFIHLCDPASASKGRRPKKAAHKRTSHALHPGIMLYRLPHQKAR